MKPHHPSHLPTPPPNVPPHHQQTIQLLHQLLHQLLNQPVSQPLNQRKQLLNHPRSVDQSPARVDVDTMDTTTTHHLLNIQKHRPVIQPLHPWHQLQHLLLRPVPLPTRLQMLATMTMMTMMTMTTMDQLKHLLLQPLLPCHQLQHLLIRPVPLPFRLQMLFNCPFYYIPLHCIRSPRRLASEALFLSNVLISGVNEDK